MVSCDNRAIHLRDDSSLTQPIFKRMHSLRTLPDAMMALPALEKLDLRWLHDLEKPPAWIPDLEARGGVVYI